MTISTTTSRADYVGNGVTTSYAVPFYFLDNTHLAVIRTVIATGVSTTLVLGVDYTLSGAGSTLGGTLTLGAALAATNRLSIVRNTPYTQLVDYVENDPFPANTHEMALDKLTMECQQLLTQISRSLVFPDGDPSSLSGVLPSQIARANKYLGFDSNGNPIATGSTIDIAALTSLLLTLPTTLPAASGVLWLNGGVLCMS